jgi:uncharacterized protein YbjT (DUF2867 family)
MKKMKILVIGGTGLIGSGTVRKLQDSGHDVISASPNNGIDTITGEGLAEAIEGCEVVIDLSNSPSFADEDVMAFFETSGRNILTAEINAGVKHHIALSVVGTDRLQQSGYFRAKQAQEDLIRKSGVPYTIIHSTQFLEFLDGIIASGSDGSSITLSKAKIQPIAAAEVSELVAGIALKTPANGIVEIGGPEQFTLSGLVTRYLEKTGSTLKVTVDEKAPYFGAILEESTLVPADNATLGKLTFEEWFPNRPQRK